MKLKGLLAMLGVVFLAGCTTTQPPSDMSKLQIRVAQLERKVNEKDQEINDLKYEIKELTTQLDEDDSYTYTEFDPIEEPGQPKIVSYEDYIGKSPKEDKRIIRVSAKAKQVQQALKNAGYYDAAIDGKLGTQSKKAIKDFQKDHDLTSDGIIGKKTWSELRTYLD